MQLFENVRDSFAAATGFPIENSPVVGFYHNIANMLPDVVDVDTLILALKIALKEAEEKGVNTVSFISVIPEYVIQCTSFEFAHEFREKYISEILGISKEDLPDVHYGYTEVDKDIIDISNKNKFDVFAALYNASIPAGAGFMHYNPVPWNRETAEYYFNHYGQLCDDKETILFKWVVGRICHVYFKDNLVYVRTYNANTEPGLAQRVIDTCPNIEREKPTGR